MLNKKRHLLGEGGAVTADSMCAEYIPLSPSSQPKRSLKPFLSSRSIRGYLLERHEFLRLYPDATEFHLTMIEALEMLLDASEPGRVA